MPWLLTSLLLVDLVLFNGFIQGAPDPSGATTSSATANALAAIVAAQGTGPAGELHRVAMFDPDRYYAVQAERLGQPDLTILRGLDSVQGYGAVVDGSYDRATDTHEQLNMNPAGLADGAFAQLDLGVLATVPEYFVHPATAAPGIPNSVISGATPIPPEAPSAAAPAAPAVPLATPANDYQYAPPPASTVSLVPGQPRTQFLGAVLSVTAVTVPVQAGAPGQQASLRVGLLSSDGRRTTWIGSASAGPRQSGTATVSAPSPTPASGIVLEAVTGGTLRLRPGEDRRRPRGHRRPGHLPCRRLAARLGDPGALALRRHDRRLLRLHRGVGSRASLGTRWAQRCRPGGVELAVGRPDHPRHHGATRHLGARRAVRHRLAGHRHDRRWTRLLPGPPCRHGPSPGFDPGRVGSCRNLSGALHLSSPSRPRGVRRLCPRLHGARRAGGVARCSASS